LICHFLTTTERGVMKRRNLLALLVILTGLVPVAVADVVLKQPEFAITLPKGWGAIPGNVMAAINDAAKTWYQEARGQDLIMAFSGIRIPAGSAIPI
jgi:hypothetical protein